MVDAVLAKAARGSWQREILRDMVRGPVNPIRELRGRAARYSRHYEFSLENLVKRIDSTGTYRVEVGEIRTVRGRMCKGYRVVVSA